MQQAIPNEVDVIVIGGGVMGTSTAFFLAAETDLEVLLLEKGNIATGSTGDSSAILRHHYGPQERYTRMAAWSHEFYRAFEERTEQPLAYARNPLVRFAVEGTAGAEYVEAGYEVLEALDIPVSWYESEAFTDRYPMLQLDDFDFAVSDDSAAYADGTDAANGFARAAAERGARIVTDTAAEAVHANDGSVTGVASTAGTIGCEDVVIAAGPWTPQIATTIGIDVPLKATREQVVILEPPADYRKRYPTLTPTTALAGGEWYMRPDFGDGVLVATHHTDEVVDPERYDQQPDEQKLLELTDRLTETVPGLADAGITGQYCGVYSSTPDHDFVIDEVGPEGCFLACGFSGHGFKHGPAVGRIITDLIVSSQTPLVDVEYFSLDRFSDDPNGHGLPVDLA